MYLSDVVKRDILLIKELIKNGRASYSYLAQVTGLSYTSIRERLERLIDKGFLEIKPLVSPKIYGDKAAVVRVKASKPGKLLDVLTRCNRVISAVKIDNSVVAIIVGMSKTELTAVTEYLIKKCGEVEEFTIEYGTIPQTQMIPLKNPLIGCEECIQLTRQRPNACLPIPRIRKSERA